MKTLPKEVIQKLQQWVKVCRVLHFWEQDETYFIVVETSNVNNDDPDLYFLRIFQLGSTWYLSQDGVRYGI